MSKRITLSDLEVKFLIDVLSGCITSNFGSGNYLTKFGLNSTKKILKKLEPKNDTKLKEEE